MVESPRQAREGTSNGKAELCGMLVELCNMAPGSAGLIDLMSYSRLKRHLLLLFAKHQYVFTPCPLRLELMILGSRVPDYKNYLSSRRLDKTAVGCLVSIRNVIHLHGSIVFMEVRSLCVLNFFNF